MYLNIKSLMQDSKVTQINQEFKIEDKRILITGRNGIGKTHLLNEFYYLNIDKCFYVPQNPILFNDFSVSKNIELITQNKLTISDLISFLNSNFNVKFNLKTNVRKLSGGEKQLLLICIGLCLNKEILILDEPTNNLDSENINSLKRILIDYQNTIILTSHMSGFDFKELNLNEYLSS